MSMVADILSFKSNTVVTVSEDASILDAAQVMNQHRIGSVVVMGTTEASGSSVIGILTERDVLTRVVAAVRDPRHTRVSEVMTTPVETCTPTTLLEDLRRVMKDRRIRHVPVVEGSALRGMVSIGDLNAHDSMALAGTVEVLEAYITRS